MIEEKVLFISDNSDSLKFRAILVLRLDLLMDNLLAINNFRVGQALVYE